MRGDAHPHSIFLLVQENRIKKKDAPDCAQTLWQVNILQIGVFWYLGSPLPDARICISEELTLESCVARRAEMGCKKKKRNEVRMNNYPIMSIWKTTWRIWAIQ